MELLPIIYNSLIIAAGLFVVTIAISYVSYKIKQKNENEEAPSSEAANKHLDKKPDTELKPKYKSTPPPKAKEPRKETPQRKERIEKNEVREKRSEKRSEKIDREEKPVRKKPQRDERDRDRGRDTRIEVVKDLSKSPPDMKEAESNEEEKKRKDKEKKKKTNLKSIGDDPLDKYTDSADDDLHPLKTDDD